MLRFWQRGYPIFLVSLVIGALTAGFGPPKLVDREIGPTQRLSVGELRVWAESAEPPAVTAGAVLLYDSGADRILFERNRAAPLPPASLTKLMTALVVLEHVDLHDVVTIAEDDLVEGASMGLTAGETLTVEQLLWGLLIASGNDAAMALARHAGGSTDAFVQMMNQRASELGLAQTHFVNPHGLDTDGHVSSAQDMLTLSRLAMANPLIREVVATRTAEVAGHSLRSTNELLGQYQGVNGVKTGTTELAGECLVLSIKHGQNDVFIVVMGSADRYMDAIELYEYYVGVYDWLEPEPNELSVFNRVARPDGGYVYLEASGVAPAKLARRWGESELVGFRDVDFPSDNAVLPGMEIGSLEWRSGDTVVGRQALVVR